MTGIGAVRSFDLSASCKKEKGEEERRVRWL